MPRPANTEERRAQIVRGLQAVMATHGYERATVAEIAEAAGLTPGLVHYHFENKQEILLALVERLAQLWRARAADDERPAPTPRARVGRLIDAWLLLDERADRAAVACWVALASEALRQPAVRAPYLAAVRACVASFEHALRDAL